MIAFHGDPALKEAAIARMREHREQERLVQGTYWRSAATYAEIYGGSVRDGYVGCALGCLVAEAIGWGVYGALRVSDDLRAAYEPLFGIPVALAAIEEAIFEGMDGDEAFQWPEQFLEAIPVGADLTTIDWQGLLEDAFNADRVAVTAAVVLERLRSLDSSREDTAAPAVLVAV